MDSQTKSLGALTVPEQEPTHSAFATFYEQEHGDLFTALWLVTRDRHEAEEILQDAFLKLWERWDQVSGLDDPTGYLYRTAMNGLRNRVRRAKVALRKTAGLMPPDDGLARVEERESIVRALAPLTPGQRSAVVLTHVLGYTSEEAAGLLGVSASTVRVQAGRGRAQMKLAMGEDHE